MILDGIVGQVLSREEAKKRIENDLSYLGDTKVNYYVGGIVRDIAIADKGNRHTEHPQSLKKQFVEYINDLADDAEIIAEYDTDPFVKRAWDMERELNNRYKIGFSSLSRTPSPLKEQIIHETLSDMKHYDFVVLDVAISDPPPTFPSDPFDPEKRLLHGIKEAKYFKRVGCEVIIRTPDPKITIIRKVWVRNLRTHCFFISRIAENIAKYLALKQAYILFIKKEG
jgi:hypothetical protein